MPVNIIKPEETTLNVNLKPITIGMIKEIDRKGLRKKIGGKTEDSEFADAISDMISICTDLTKDQIKEMEVKDMIDVVVAISEEVEKLEGLEKKMKPQAKSGQLGRPLA